MDMPIARSLDDYQLLGRSGLRVSPLALGTMTFGTDWGWGADAGEARRIFDAYLDRGGNFVDTANRYTNGSSERMLGTDYIDLLYLHVWDGTTPVDEILRAMDDLVRAGKVLYLGISDTPAWQVSRMQALADVRGWSPLVALQIEYSLIQRTVERDLIPMARELGLGVIPWSPLGSGVLTGKYSRADLEIGSGAAQPAGTRKNIAAGNGALTERGLAIAEVVQGVAGELGASPAQVAIAWTLLEPAVTAPILGARTLAQLEDNLGALELQLEEGHQRRLAAASRIELGFPHDFINRPLTRSAAFGDLKVPVRR
jgi:aryl-alcohol dehydrogenase-like predicted oxidoreductase